MQYRVRIEYRTTSETTVTVEAESEEEAKQLAEDQVDADEILANDIVG